MSIRQSLRKHTRRNRAVILSVSLFMFSVLATMSIRAEYVSREFDIGIYHSFLWLDVYSGSTGDLDRMVLERRLGPKWTLSFLIPPLKYITLPHYEAQVLSASSAAELASGVKINAQTVQIKRYFLPLIWLLLILALSAYPVLRRVFPLRLSDQCSNCGYCIRGNCSGVCPECGTPIPPEQIVKNGNPEQRPSS